MKFIIYAFRYSENSGGNIVLHYLCHILNTLGYDAKIWPNYKPIFDITRPIMSILKFLKYYKKELHKKFSLNENWMTPIATSEDLIEDDIVIIYPEIVKGNPLKGKQVVRWMLHKPGFHTSDVNFGCNDLIFFYSTAFMTDNFKNTNILNIFYIMSDVYKNENFGERTGTCYMVKKGIGKSFIHTKDALCVDGYSHYRLSEAFNRYKFFISYDSYTTYSRYAALCGCVSIVVPDDGVDKNEWHPTEENRYGLAYGLEDINYALDTLPLLNDLVTKQHKNNILGVKEFVDKCKNYFIYKGNKE